MRTKHFQNLCGLAALLLQAFPNWRQKVSFTSLLWVIATYLLLIFLGHCYEEFRSRMSKRARKLKKMNKRLKSIEKAIKTGGKE